MRTRPWTLSVAIATALVSAPSLAAVTLDTHGLGEGLLFPYFTTNNGQSTLVAVQNTTALGKALKVRVMESYGGYETLTFNIYIAPHGTWNAALTLPDPGANKPAYLMSGSETCSAPQIPDTGFPLVEYAYMVDDGPDSLERTREGFVEIVEMGTMDAALSELVSAPNTSNCEALRDRFDPGREWSIDPNADLTAPSGGLRGSALLIDTADGTAFNYTALGFNGLSIGPRHIDLTPVGQDLLSPRLTDIEVAAAEDIEVQVINADGTATMLRYDDSEGYNAISALLANNAAHSTFSVDAGMRARTEWIYSFPTRHAHKQTVIIGTPPPNVLNAPPFAATSSNCEEASVSMLDRNGIASGESETVALCGSAGVIRFAADGLDTAPILALDDDPTVEAPFAAGTSTFDFSQFGDDARASLPDLDGRCFVGLPVWAMAVSAYDNDNAQVGRIATFPVEELASRVTNIVDCSSN